MEPGEYVEIARAESERGEVVVRERQGDGPAGLELRVNGIFVMDTVETSSETALAHQALRLVEEPSRVLIGGLGLGFTLDAVLGDPRVEHCTVVEIEDSLVRWMRDGTIPHGPGLLADDRLTLTVADVAIALVEARPESYDLVLLDVDNGPGYLVYDANAALYRVPFLESCRQAVAPGGVLVIWSADEASELFAAMEGVFGNCRARACEVEVQDRHEHHWLYVSRVPSAS
ncbi:putative spermidine synthetase [metagenome]|uniref:Putative spermidine synthetase n=1 Tax=metagenome TaxID=256318 RepID=A0A2P2BZL7_9ZZZZ